MVFDNDKMAFWPKNFKYLDELIHSGAKEIILDLDIVLGDGEESEYKDGINLNVDGLTINGNGHTIDAQGKARIFYCRGKNITIKSIILENGCAKENGGAIKNSWTGKLTIIESAFQENIAQFDGGAIHSLHGELTITGSTFNNNTSDFHGGAIHSLHGELTITNSTLIGNTANKCGGAIYSEGRLEIIGSTLTGNSATYGGAVLNEGGLEIIGSTLTGNDSAFGGAIYLCKSKNYESENCTFKDNNPDDVYEED